MKAKRKTTRRTVGTHWCSGTLVKDGQRAVRCTKCDRVKFDDREPRRPPRLPNGTRVHVRSDHFEGECDGRITKGHYDAGWLYHIEVTADDRLDEHRNQDGELWVCDFEVQPLA